MDFHDASTVVNIMAKNRHILVVDKMAAEKQGTTVPPKESGMTTFGFFLAFGCVPILSFIVLIPFTNNESVKFGGACILAVLALVLLGIARAKISGGNYGFFVAICSMPHTLLALKNVAGVEDETETEV